MVVVQFKNEFLFSSMLKSALLCILFFSPSQAKKNILFLMADDLNDWVGAFEGHPQANTPNIDKLAKKGIVFRNAHCASPVCLPSRAALMTGLYAHTTKITDNFVDIARADFRRQVYPAGGPYPAGGSMKDHVTLPQYFMKNGWKTFGAGKIYHDNNKDPASWNVEYPGGVGGDGPVNEGIPGTIFTWGVSSQPTATFADMLMTKWSANKLDSNFTHPFFLTAGVFRPHYPWYIPKEFYDKRLPAQDIKYPPLLENDIADIKDWDKIRTNNGEWDGVQKAVKNTGDTLLPRKIMSAYLASINFADHTLGVILDRLEKSKYADSTIVVLMGDHGWHLGEKNHYHKSSLWVQGTQTPLIIYDPEYKALGGREVWDVVSLTDIYPTLVDLAHLAPNPINEGRSLAHFIRNTPSDYLGWAICSLRDHHTIITNTYKYTRYSQGTIELYNSKEDPNEWKNLAFNVSASSRIQDTIDMLSSDLTRILNHQKPVNIGKFSKVTTGTRYRRDFSGKSGFSFPFIPKAYDIKGVEQKMGGKSAPGHYIHQSKK